MKFWNSVEIYKMLRKRSCGRFYPITSRIIYDYSWITTFNQYVLFAKEILIGSLEQTNKIISPANSKRKLNIHRKKFYLQGKKNNRSKEYWKSLEIGTSFVRSLIEPASFLIQDLFRDESYSKELCSRGPRRFFNFEFLPENWRRETRRRLNCGSLDF